MRLLDTVGTAVVFCSEALVDPVACAFRAGGIEAGSIGVRAGGEIDLTEPEEEAPESPADTARDFAAGRPRVLVAPMSTVVRGLDLSRARAVLWLHPCENARLEEICLHTVVRIGAPEDAIVYRFAVQGSVEEQGLSSFPRHHIDLDD